MVKGGDRIDPEAWTRVLGDLLDESGMTRRAMAEALDVAERTVYRWLSNDPDRPNVTVSFVRDAARAARKDPVEVLAKVGWLSPEEAGQRGRQTPSALPPPMRQILAVLADPAVPMQVKAHLREAVTAAFDLWTRMYNLQAPREQPPSRDKSTPSAGK